MDSALGFGQGDILPTSLRIWLISTVTFFHCQAILTKLSSIPMSGWPLSSIGRRHLYRQESAILLRFLPVTSDLSMAAMLARRVLIVPDGDGQFGNGPSSYACVNVMLALEEVCDVESPDSSLRKGTFIFVAAI